MKSHDIAPEDGRALLEEIECLLDRITLLKIW
jgi:hypothetical protein